jgi:hypothetical protein
MDAQMVERENKKAGKKCGDSGSRALGKGIWDQQGKKISRSRLDFLNIAYLCTRLQQMGD